MKKFIAAATLAAFVATPAAAQTVKAGADNAALKNNAAQKSKSKAKTRKRVAAVPAAAPATVAEVWLPFFATYSPPYSSNPEYDVYVRGEYVGSDPDPRIRATLRDEWKRSFNLR